MGDIDSEHCWRYEKWVVILIGLLGIILYLAVSFGYYVAWGTEDEYITMWTGKTLAEGKGLVNHNGEPMEIGSSLLHSILLAGFYLAAPDHVFTLNRLTGLLAGGTIILLMLYKRKVLIRLPAPWNVVVLIGVVMNLAVCDPWLFWTMGGQETPIQSLILFVYAIALIEFWEQPRQPLPLILYQVLYILVRPEGVLFIAPLTIIYGIALSKIKSVKRSWPKLAGFPLVFSLGVFAARYAWSGVFLPSPALAKINLDWIYRWITVKAGLKGIFSFYTENAHTLVLGVCLVGIALEIVWALWKTWRKDQLFPDEIIPAMVMLSLVIYNHVFLLLTLVGSGMRYLVPVIPLVILLGGMFLGKLGASLQARITAPFMRFWPLSMAIVLVVGGLANFNSNWRVAREPMGDAIVGTFEMLDFRNLEESLIQLNLSHRYDIKFAESFIVSDLPVLYQQSGNRLVILTGQMGYFPFTIKHLYPDMNIRFVDLAGLADLNVAQLHQPKNTVGVYTGAYVELIVTNQLGDFSRYVLAQEPNLVYALWIRDGGVPLMVEHGWQVIRDEPGGVVLYRE